jgi:hypothetical protein
VGDGIGAFASGWVGVLVAIFFGVRCVATSGCKERAATLDVVFGDFVQQEALVRARAHTHTHGHRPKKKILVSCGLRSRGRFGTFSVARGISRVSPRDGCSIIVGVRNLSVGRSRKISECRLCE